MLLIERYVISETRRPLSVMVIVLTVIFASYSSERYLAQAASGILGLDVVLDIVFYKVLIALEVLVPVALYIAVVMGLGRLGHDVEMTAIAAAGISPLQMYRAVAFLAVPIAIAVTLLSLYGRPWAYANAYQLEQRSRTDLDVNHLLAERFNVNEENGRMILAERIDHASGRLHNVLIFDPGDSKTHLFRAREAWIADSAPQAPVVELERGNAYALQRSGSRDQRTVFERMTLHLTPIEPAADHRRKAASSEELAASAALPDQAELQWRQTRGATTLLLALIAVPLSRTPPRRGRFASLLPVTAVYAVIFYAGDILKSLLENGSLPLIPGLWMKPALMGLVLALLVRRDMASAP